MSSSDTGSRAGDGNALEAFDAAIAAELPRVSHVEYDSHEICKHFAGEVRRRLAAAPSVSAPAAALTPEQLADKCEAWLQAGGASNIVDAYEAGYRDCEAAHTGRKPTRAPDYPGEVIDPDDTARLAKLFEGKTVDGVLGSLGVFPSPATGEQP